MSMPTPTPKQQFLNGFKRETATTLKVLRSYPPDQLDLRPSPRSATARDLAWLFVMEQAMGEKALTTGFDWSAPPPKSPAPPDSLDAIIKAAEDAFQRIVALVERTPDDQLGQTVQFPVGPRQIGDVPKMEFLWFLLCDQIHHRGQLSVYLRMAGGKVPSIYGPSGDEPWS
jgi:uncharacterized damage-inducible protein DinB